MTINEKVNAIIKEYEKRERIYSDMFLKILKDVAELGMSGKIKMVKRITVKEYFNNHKLGNMIDNARQDWLDTVEWETLTNLCSTYKYR